VLFVVHLVEVYGYCWIVYLGGFDMMFEGVMLWIFLGCECFEGFCVVVGCVGVLFFFEYVFMIDFLWLEGVVWVVVVELFVVDLWLIVVIGGMDVFVVVVLVAVCDVGFGVLGDVVVVFFDELVYVDLFDLLVIFLDCYDWVFG